MTWFECIKNIFFEQIRVYARPDAIDTVDYALWTGVQITEYFENYFDIPFPLKKQGKNIS